MWSLKGHSKLMYRDVAPLHLPNNSSDTLDGHLALLSQTLHYSAMLKSQDNQHSEVYKKAYQYFHSKIRLWMLRISFFFFLSNFVIHFKCQSFTLLLTEIEAKEACTWLRAAGFPQYAQLYEGRTPVFPTSPVHDQNALSYSGHICLTKCIDGKTVVLVRDVA